MLEIYKIICFLLQKNLERYDNDGETKAKLENAFETFQRGGFNDSTFEDEKSIAALNTVLQQFLNADKREISLKAAEGKRSEDAESFESLLDAFGLRKEIALPDPIGKTIAIFGANMGGMQLRARWLSEQLTKYPEAKPQIIFLTGDRAVFPHVKEERAILGAEIAQKISEVQGPVEPDLKNIGLANAIIDSAVEQAKQITSSPQHLQAIIPLIIMREVNKIAPKSYEIQGLNEVDLQDNSKALEILKIALATRIYPSETSVAKIVAQEFLHLSDEALLPAGQMSKDYRATTRDNANVLLNQISEGKCRQEVILVSSQPFCTRQFNDVMICLEDQKAAGIKLEISGPAHVDKRVNPDTTLDVLARHVYTENQLFSARAKRAVQNPGTIVAPNKCQIAEGQIL